jgi:hypothetical protein
VRLLIFLVYVLATHCVLSQELSEVDIERIALKLDSKLRGVDTGAGIYLRRCLANGRKIIYEYDYPANVVLAANLKAEVIQNYRMNGFSKTCYKNKIDVELFYFQENELKHNVSISWKELSDSDFSLGEYVSIKGHPKSKGVNLKLRSPVGWEFLDGDRPNIVKKFIHADNIYLILIRDNSTFVSRKEAKEFFSDGAAVDELIEGTLHPMTNFKVVSKEAVTLDNYPAMQFAITGELEQMGVKSKFFAKVWLVFFEDKVVMLQGICADSRRLESLEVLYNQITNSIIFPEQYE